MTEYVKYLCEYEKSAFHPILHKHKKPERQSSSRFTKIEHGEDTQKDGFIFPLHRNFINFYIAYFCVHSLPV